MLASPSSNTSSVNDGSVTSPVVMRLSLCKCQKVAVNLLRAFFLNPLQVLCDVGNSCLIKQTSFDYKLHQDLRVELQICTRRDRREKESERRTDDCVCLIVRVTESVNERGRERERFTQLC